METPSFKEDHISQLPALQLLITMGWQYLGPEEAMRLRGGKTSNVLLDEVLRQQLKAINSEKKISSTRSTYISDANIENGIRALKELPLNEGYISASQALYNLITLGKAFEQNVGDDKKSFTLQYIDWSTPGNNVFHVTEEYPVMRSNSRDHYIPDLVLFVNGIPMCIIECKRPDKKEPLKQAISQQLRSQQEDGIRNLYVYTQLLLCVATDSARYGTNGTEEKFWAIWNETFTDKDAEGLYRQELESIKNKPLNAEQENKVFRLRSKAIRQHFKERQNDHVAVTVEDEYLYNLCRPERLLDLAYNFMVFDDGVKKIAKYQQYSVIKKTMNRILVMEDGRRKGGVVWHTQGSGKSLTMVMLAQAIALEKQIRNPKIVLVTDRIDLDDQITGTFRKSGIFVENASTGQRLVELLQSKSDAVITTVINKFEAAVKKIPKPLESADIFVLVDEGHRTQHGTFNIDMQKTLPNACFIAFTGTPLFKRDKNTAKRFGGMIDAYTVDQAVRDKAVVPLLYEGRHAHQQVNEKPLDNYFNMVSEPLNEYQRADMKRKFSRADQLNVAEQKIYAICWDISYHYRDNFQHTPFKGQLVCQSKAAAIKYKEFLDKINIVSTELLISPPDEREGEDSAYAETSDAIKRFWKKMMDEHGTPKKYQNNIINRYKKSEQPEIIIVVDKLLTGFDEPKNAVLYLTRNLQGHTLLQAIARVNRVYPDKDYGYIIDYYGVIEQLDEALDLYSSMDEFEKDELEGTLINIHDEIKKLPQAHSEVWDLFKTITNKRDAEAYQQLLKDEHIRVLFYSKLAVFARLFKMALSSIEFHTKTDAKLIQRYKDDLAFFAKLRIAVLQRYSDIVDYKQYEGQIQKLIDTHIQTDGVEVITGLVNIFDKEKFQKEIENTIGQAAKADKIASRTAKHITEKMDEDPAFYKKFSEMLKDAIEDFEKKRIDAAQYLNRTTQIMESVLSHTDADIPEALQYADVAKAFYGIGNEELRDKLPNAAKRKQVAIDSALAIDEIIKGMLKVNWQNEVDIPKKMIHLIGDYLIDEVRDKYEIPMSFEEIDQIAERCVNVAKIRYKK